MATKAYSTVQLFTHQIWQKACGHAWHCLGTLIPGKVNVYSTAYNDILDNRMLLNVVSTVWRSPSCSGVLLLFSLLFKTKQVMEWKDLYCGGEINEKKGRLHEAKGLLVTCTWRDKGKNNKQKRKKWHKIFLLITNTCDIIAFSTFTKWQLGFKQMLMTYKQYNT